ncbi:hypothetical protein GCM10009624_02700 [Gordonia sinesedis]
MIAADPARSGSRRRMISRHLVHRLAAPVVDVRVAVVTALVAVIVIGALTAAVVVQARGVADDATVADRRSALRTDAGTIVAQVFTVRTASWRADRARARTQVTADFAARFAAELDRAPAAGTSSVGWRTRTVALGDVTADTGTAVLAVSVVTESDGVAPRTDDRTVSAHFRYVDDRWLLDGLDVLS